MPETKGLVDQPVPSLEQEHAPQAPSDRQASGYKNDVSGSSWLRNGNACTKPSFDYTGKGTKEKV